MQSCLHAASLLREISEVKKMWQSLLFDPFASHKSGDFHEVALFARTKCTKIAHKRFIETVKMLLRLVFRCCCFRLSSFALLSSQVHGSSTDLISFVARYFFLLSCVHQNIDSSFCVSSNRIVFYWRKLNNSVSG